MALLGTYHKEENHWTLVYIDLVKTELLYIDPLALLHKHNKAEEFADYWMEWALLHNQYLPNAAVPMHLTPITMKHAVQRDGHNCSIFTMCVHTILHIMQLPHEAHIAIGLGYCRL